MKAMKLLLARNSNGSRHRRTKAGRPIVRCAYLTLMSLVISVCSIFLLQALTLAEDRGMKLCESGECKIAQVPMKPKGLSVISNLSVKDKVASSGKKALELLPRGEPGGRVIGRGKDIQGFFRLVRIQHELADWWADQSSLVALTEWLNTQTRIKTDI